MKRALPIFLLLLVLALYFIFDLDRYVNLEALVRHRLALNLWVEQHPWLAPLGYIASYIVVVAFSLPLGLVMTLTGGFLFGAVAGTLYAAVGATVGSTLLFMVAKTSLGDYLLAKAGGSFKRMQQGFAENAMSYLLVLRLIPIFPFFIVNLAPAFLGVPLRTYVIATFFGILPAGFVFALAGAGIGGVLDRGGDVTVSGILTPQILGSLIGLAVLALLPVLYKRYRGGSAAGDDE